ncbi:MAG: ABC transporter ATP-binding protein [Planctomycetota bacterium]
MSLLARTRRRFGLPFALLLRHRLAVLLGLGCIPIHTAASLAIPHWFGSALDVLARTDASDGTDRKSALFACCAVIMLLAFVEVGARYVSRKKLIDASREVERDLKARILAHMSRLPIAWFDRSRTGDLVSRLTQDVEMVRFVVGPMILHGLTALTILPGGVYLMARENLPVTLACGSVFLLLFVLLRALVPRLARWSRASQEAIGDLSQRAQEDFAGISVLHQYAATERERAALARSNRRYLLANLRLVRLRQGIHAATHASTGLVTLGVLVVGGIEVVDGALSLGGLLEFVIYLGMMLFPLQVLGWTLSALPRAVASADRIAEVFDAEQEPTGGSTPTLRGELQVRDLTFRYEGQTRPALRGVSFRLPAGSKLGLVGPVGSGKSTLLALCLRLYDPPRGTVFVDGHDVLDIDPAALRATFAFAPQEPFLFSDTIAANVAFAMDGLSAADLETAVAAAALDQDLAQFASGLDTMVGERGVTLSGGQKQRVSLARAMASNRAALILDDTLSAVDPETERRILEGLRRHRRGRTMLLATHRLAAVADADLILVLESGSVVERGRHDDLMAAGRGYAEAFRRQAEASALEGGDEP